MTEVILPLASTANTGTVVEEPYVLAVTPEFARVPVEVTLTLPSKLTFHDKSPVISIFLAVANLVAVSALPIN